MAYNFFHNRNVKRSASKLFIEVPINDLFTQKTKYIFTWNYRPFSQLIVINNTVVKHQHETLLNALLSVPIIFKEWNFNPLIRAYLKCLFVCISFPSIISNYAFACVRQNIFKNHIAIFFKET